MEYTSMVMFLLRGDFYTISSQTILCSHVKTVWGLSTEFILSRAVVVAHASALFYVSELGLARHNIYFSRCELCQTFNWTNVKLL